LIKKKASASLIEKGKEPWDIISFYSKGKKETASEQYQKKERRGWPQDGYASLLFGKKKRVPPLKTKRKKKVALLPSRLSGGRKKEALKAVE